MADVLMRDKTASAPASRVWHSGDVLRATVFGPLGLPRGLPAPALVGIALLVAGLLALAVVLLVPAQRSTPVAVAPVEQAEEPQGLVGEPPAPGSQSPFATIAEPPPAPPQRTSFTSYTVQPGDTLWQISERYQLRPETILWSNDIANADLIMAGETLQIPPVDGVLYTVLSGDRVADLVDRFGVDPTAIAAANAIQDLDQIQMGAKLFLPGARPVRPTTAIGADSVQAPGTDSQVAAAINPNAPVPGNIDKLLAAGWLYVDSATALFKTAETGAKVLHQVPEGVRLERLDGFRNGRIQVRDPGDGKSRQAMTGWVSAIDTDVGRAPGPRELPLSYPANAAMDIAQVFAPYRTQLDGTAYAEANCGPTTVAMALDAFGIHLTSGQARAEALDVQRMWGNGTGTLITALATVAQNHGASVLGLRNPDGGIHRWSLDDVRSHVAQGHPVVVQARYRSLPGRGNVAYYGDHYILVTGVVPGGFLYNDAVNTDGIGWDRVMSAERLASAMDASDRRYAYAAFAVGR